MRGVVGGQKIDELKAEHPAVFKPGFLKRYAVFLALTVCALYTAYCWWFFSVGKTLRDANWDIAGNYLADWVSYEIRPDIEFEGNHLVIEFPRFSPLGDDPKPEWLRTTSAVVDIEQAAVETGGQAGGGQKKSFMQPTTRDKREETGSFMQPTTRDRRNGGEDSTVTAEAVDDPVKSETSLREAIVAAEAEIGTAVITVVPGEVTVSYRGESHVFDVIPDESVTPRGPLPSWASQREEGDKVRFGFGWAGRAEIQNDEVVIRRRFLGWENFWFGTDSKFWPLSTGERIARVFSGNRLDPDMSNLALAWRDFLYNPGWQHLDVWTKLLQTIIMAFVGTVFASLLAFPLSFVAARNITPNRLVNQVLKRIFDFLRSVDMLIWALFFTRAFGPGPLAGISAIFFTDTGTFGKLYSETLENIDDRQREGVRSVGANPPLVQRYGVAPQVLPVFLSQSLYFWESNTRSATIIGAVGAGGIGLKLWEAMRTNQDWENVAYMVILVLVVVFVFDNISNALRSRLIGGMR
ncbi:MAG: phosphonate ABC transporter, permease protein PhnE [Rhizobiaceae bacterium]